MKTNLKPSFLKPSILLSVGLAVSSLPLLGTNVQAQDGLSSEPMVTCLYSADMGEADPLANQGFITAREVEGGTEFSFVSAFQRLPTEETVEVSDIPVGFRSTNTLVFSGASLDDARSQLFTGNPIYYNTLLGRAADSEVTDDERITVNENLDCSDQTAENTDEPPVTEGPQPNPDLDLANLPDGNYRVISANFPMRVVSDEELLEAGGALFLFQKVGDRITGIYGFIDHEGSSCITGTLSGNRVMGDAYAYSDAIRSGVFLTLGDDFEDGFYLDSVLDLSSFSRINAGTRLPVTDCPL